MQVRRDSPQHTPLGDKKKMPMTTKEQKFGSLRCHVVDCLDGRSPKLIVVLCHGFGAPGTDLVGLAEPFLNAADEIADNVRFIFPEAPNDLAAMGMPGGRAWWPINMEQLAMMHQTRDFKELSESEPDGLRSASDALAESLQAMLEDSGLQQKQMFLGGFSQGAMVSTDVVLQTGLEPAALVLMSGTMLCREDWTRLAGEHPGIPVIQTHGTMDMVLPIEPAMWLRDMLTESGFPVQYKSFTGPHTVPPEALQMTAQAIMQSLNGSSE